MFVHTRLPPTTDSSQSAVQHLFPISSHPRSRPSAPAAEQLRFCQLALSLLDQASLHTSPVQLDAASVIPETHVGENEEPATSSAGPSSIDTSLSRRKYALLQRLPNGDWWSSLNSSYPSLAAEDKELKDLPTSYAELVAVFPSASASTAHPPTLGHYIKKKSFRPLAIPQPRNLSCGNFLQYGPYASFAPTFEQSGREVGRAGLSDVIWFKEKDQHRRANVRAYRERLLARAAEKAIANDDEEVESDRATSRQKEKMQEGDLSGLEGILTSEQIANIKSAAGSLELEDAISELLERNARALERLEVLQMERLMSSDEGSRDVEAGSEEWDTGIVSSNANMRPSDRCLAQGILDSLTLLASFRPRSSSDVDDTPLVPPSSVLRRLHRTLPFSSTQGWHGTLPDTRATACRDDMTVKVRPGAPIAAPAPAPAPVPAPMPSAAPLASTPAKPAPATYSNYSYSSYTTPYRGAYGTYTPQSTTNYYPNYQSSAASTAQTSNASHYPSHHYSSSNQQPYSAYSSWYNYQPPAGAASSAPSGQATPQASKPANYVGYYGNTQQPQPQRAVANTVLTAGSAASKSYAAAGSWNGVAQIAPTLPPHMRGAVSATPSAPGTPQPAAISTATSYSSYYNQYQPPPTPTPTAAQ